MTKEDHRLIFDDGYKSGIQEGFAAGLEAAADALEMLPASPFSFLAKDLREQAVEIRAKTSSQTL